MRRWLTLTCAAATVMAAAACSVKPASTHTSRPRRAGASARCVPAIAVVTTSAWWKPDPAPNCGSPALARVSGRVELVGDCAGLLIIPADAMTLRSGQRIDVHVLDASLPRSSDRAVLAQITVSPNGATGTYQALRPGHATLVSAVGWCVGLKVKGEIKGNCPFLDVTVLAADWTQTMSAHFLLRSRRTGLAPAELDG